MAQLERAEAASAFINLMIYSIWGSEESITRAQFLQRSEAIAMRQLRGRPESRAVVLHSLAAYHASLGDQKEALRLRGQALEVLPEDAEVSVRASIECAHALQNALVGDPGPARTTIAGFVANPDVDPQVAAQCEIYLAHIAQTYSDPAAALRHALGAWQRLQAAPRAPAELIASAHANLGYGYAMNNRIQEADRHYDTAIASYRELGQTESPAVVAILNNWALVSFRAGDFRHMLSQLDEVVRLAAGPDPPPYVVHNRGAALLGLGRHAEALAEAGRAIELAERSGRLNLKFSALGTRIAAHAALGDLDAAERAYREAEALVRANAAIGRTNAQLLPLRRARIELLRGNLVASRAAAQQVIDAAPDPLKGGGSLIGALLVRAEVAQRFGQHQAALADAGSALAVAQKVQGGRLHSTRTGETWLLLARLRRDGGDIAGARVAAREALTHLTATLDEPHADISAARELAAR